VGWQCPKPNSKTITASDGVEAIQIVEGIVEEPELGRIYRGKVVRITDFGAFVEILPGTDGLLHISQIDFKRINKVTDVLHEGDEVPVKVIEIDKMGRIRLSRKEALKEKKEEVVNWLLKAVGALTFRSSLRVYCITLCWAS